MTEEKRKSISVEDIILSEDLAELRLKEGERNLLTRFRKANDEKEKELGRPLTDEESLDLEKRVPGISDVLAKLDNMSTGSFKEVRRKGKNIQ